MENNIPRHPQRRGDGRVPTLREAMQQLFDESFWDPFEGGRLAPAGGMMQFPKVDVSEDEQNVYVTADVPGVSSDQIDLKVEDDTLILSGTIDREEKDEDKHYYRYEREYGQFHRAVPLPASVDREKARAKTKDGVLTVTLPKAEEGSGTKIEIESA